MSTENIPKTPGGLYLPPKGTLEWGGLNNANFVMVEEKIETAEKIAKEASAVAQKADGIAQEAKKAAQEASNALGGIVPDILIIQSEPPAGNAKKLWVNTGDSMMHYWNGSEWTPIVGFWGDD